MSQSPEIDATFQALSSAVFLKVSDKNEYFLYQKVNSNVGLCTLVQVFG